MAFGVLVTSTFNSTITGASEKDNDVIIAYETNAYNLKDNFDKSSKLCNKLLSDVGKLNTGLN